MSVQTITHDRILHLMNHYRLSARKLSVAAGASSSTLNAFLNRSDARLTTSVLANLATILNCTQAYLLGETDEVELKDLPGSLDGRPPPSQRRKAVPGPVSDPASPGTCTLTLDMTRSPLTARIKLDAELPWDIALKIAQIVQENIKVEA